MYDTIKIKLNILDVDQPWNVEELKNNLMPADKYARSNYKPTGMLRNMAVFANEELIYIDGSIAKYWNNCNIENFDFRHFRIAMMKLSEELGVDLRKAKIHRVDIAANIELKEEVSDYFPELCHLKYYQRDTSKKTTLRFYSNTGRNNLIFYDKIKEFTAKNNKLFQDDTSLVDTFENLMRYEFMMQSNPAKHLKIPELRVEDLFVAINSKKALSLWFKMYFDIEKKAVLEYPKTLVGLAGFEKFMKRYIVQTMGWEEINFLMKNAMKRGCFSASSKSKKLKDFDEAMHDDFNFKLNSNTKELNHKIKVMYVEGLKQIFKMP